MTSAFSSPIRSYSSARWAAARRTSAARSGWLEMLGIRRKSSSSRKPCSRVSSRNCSRVATRGVLRQPPPFAWFGASIGHIRSFRKPKAGGGRFCHRRVLPIPLEGCGEFNDVLVPGITRSVEAFDEVLHNHRVWIAVTGFPVQTEDEFSGIKSVHSRQLDHGSQYGLCNALVIRKSFRLPVRQILCVWKRQGDD